MSCLTKVLGPPSYKKAGLNGITRRAALGGMALTLAAAGLGCGKGCVTKPGKKLLILGFDGMDFGIVGEMLKDGLLPNLAKVAGQGAYLPLMSSTPPQSPVAWANFITGQNPGKHGVFDFIVRDPKTYGASLSISRLSQANRYLKLFNRGMLVEHSDALLLRKGKSWWNILEENGVAASVFCVPSNFPPEESGQRTLSGMGTPDINGTMGTSTFFTTAPDDSGFEPATFRIQVQPVDGVIDTAITGLRDYTRAGNPGIDVPLRITLDQVRGMARLDFQGMTRELAVGEWSGWHEVSFNRTALTETSGIVRFYLKSVAPEFWLYMSPVNIDPAEPAHQISTPPELSAEMTDALGLRYTQGIPEDNIVLDEGWLDEDEYLTQARLALAEKTALFKLELERFARAEAGAYFCYFGTTDSCSHMFWRFRDPKHPMHDPAKAKKYGGIVEEFYIEMDGRVGHALETLPKDAGVIVMSDHGFASYRRGVHINRWLYENGFLYLKDDARGESDKLFENVDFPRTAAYAMGVNGLYINVMGRDGQGAIHPRDKGAIVATLIGMLREFRDPDTGEKVISEAFDSSMIYSGPETAQAPDIIIGYSTGYRASWETMLGAVPTDVIRDNDKRWSGDHCMDPALVPGIFFTNMKVNNETPRIEDLAPTILAYFGVAAPSDMDGRTLI